MTPLDRATTSFYMLSIVEFYVPMSSGLAAVYLLVAMSQKRSAFPSNNWASCYVLSKLYIGAGVV